MLAESYLRSGKVRDLYRLNDGRLAARRLRPDQRVRRDPALDDPGQGPRPHRPVAVLVRRDRRDRPEPPARHGPGGPDGDLRCARSSRGLSGDAPTARPLDELRGRMMLCRPARSCPSRRSSAATSPARAGRSTRQSRHGLRHRRCPPGLRESDRLPEPIFTPATKAEDRRARREHHLRRDDRAHRHRPGDPGGGRARRADPRRRAPPLSATARPWPSGAGSCWRTPSSSSGRR